MSETTKCPSCGADLEPDAPAGLCPRCLIQVGLESGRNSGSTPESRPTTIASGFVPPEPEELARLFPHLEIIELIGRGGMGAVYKARQPGLDRLVAIKILPPEVAADPAFAERFTREARALAKLSHQNIVSVFDFGQTDGQFYFIMEYVDGTNLRQLIETQSIKPEEALAIVPQICEALQFAHNEGIVHRDIKPENILLDKQGRVKIADFGLAKLLGKAPEAVTLTAAHQVMGTLHYMAPEQMRGAGTVDHRADIYSLGVVFYEMLTGQLPIGRFEPPSRKVQVDVRLDEVVLRALENEPEKRYQNVSEVKTDVTAISSMKALAVSAGPTSDNAVFRRLTVINLIVSGLWAATFSTLQLGYILGADWYFNQDLPYDYLSVWFVIFSVWIMGGIAWWWYLLAKRPETPRSFSDFVRLAQSPDDRVKRIWKPVLVYAGICLLATIACWPLGDTARAIQMGLVFVSLPFATMTISRATYAERFSEDRHRNEPMAEGNTASPESDKVVRSAAARRLRNPMAALFLVGLLQLILSVVLASWTGVTLARIHSTSQSPETTGEIDETGNGMTVTVSPHEWWPYVHWFYTLLGVSVVSAVVGTLAMAAAVFGSRLQLEGFVRVVCGLVCIPSPVWPFGLATALIAFSILGRPNVKAAFAAVAAEDDVVPCRSILSHWSVWTALGIAMAILVIATSLISWVRINIFGIVFTGIGIENWHGIVVCVAGGLAAILIAAFATIGGSRLGQGLAACLGGLVVTTTAGYFVWEAAQPLQAETSATVTSSSGDESMQDFGNEMAESLGSFVLDSMGQQSAFGSTAAIVCGILLALVGTAQLIGPLLITALASDPDSVRHRIPGLGEAFIVVAGISVLTAIGIALWLRFAPAASLLSELDASNLKFIAVTHAVYGCCILAAGVLMLKLRGRLVVLLITTIMGIAIPTILTVNVIMERNHIPQWPAMIPIWLGVPFAIWTTRLLFISSVRLTFEESSRERSHARKSENASHSMPCISRKAIWGLCWAPFFFVLLISMTLVSSRGRSVANVPIPEDSAVATSDGQKGERDAIATTETIVANDGERSTGPSWLQWILIATIIPLGLSAPIGTTILGVLAINDIRHSQGRQTGMPLALADCLLYPLILLDGLIVCLFWFLCVLASEVFGPETTMSSDTTWMCVAITTLLSVPACAYCDFIIIRAGWRRMSPPAEAMKASAFQGAERV